MTGQDLGQLRLVFRLQQSFDCTLRQFGKGLIGRSEDRERSLALKGFYETGSLDGGDQRGVILRVDGILDDVLVFVHCSTADLWIFSKGTRSKSRDCRRKGERTDCGLEH
ncbi:hypothetical protein D3C87_1372480 [compost metagenome]